MRQYGSVCLLTVCYSAVSGSPPQPVSGNLADGRLSPSVGRQSPRIVPNGERLSSQTGRPLYSPSQLSHLCSRSKEWKSISEKEKEKLGLVTEDDGEFWMAWDDFILQFTDISINYLINTSLFTFSKTWKEVSLQSSWSRPDRAGGCLNHPDTFLDNPQLVFDIPGSDEEELVVQLSQRDESGDLTRIERDKLVMGFHIVKVEANREYRLHRRLPDSDSGTSDYIKSRHVFLRKKLKPGRYLLVPTTFEPGQEGQFLVRVFSSRVSSLDPLLLDKPPTPCLLSCGIGSLPSHVTRLTVKGATGLEKQDLVGSADPYVIVRCEGKNWSSEPVKNCLNPDWDFSLICYRRKPEKPIKIQVWNKNLMVDKFMGQCVADAKERGDRDNPFGEEATRSERRLELYGRKEDKDTRVPGTVIIIIETSKDLIAF